MDGATVAAPMPAAVMATRTAARRSRVAMADRQAAVGTAVVEGLATEAARVDTVDTEWLQWFIRTGCLLCRGYK